MGGPASTVAQLPPVSAAGHYKRPTARYEGEESELALDDTDFDEDEVNDTSTSDRTRAPPRKFGPNGISEEHLATPRLKRHRRSLHQKSIVRNAQKNVKTLLGEATEASATLGSEDESSNKSGFNVPEYVNAGSSPLISRESPHSFIEKQKRFEKEEDAEDEGNQSMAGYGDESSHEYYDTSQSSDDSVNAPVDFGAPDASALKFTP